VSAGPQSMLWDWVMEQAIIPLVEADVPLVDELGGLHIYVQDASRPVTIPSVVWDLLGDELTEIFNPIDTQWDYFARNRDQAAFIERRLRHLMHWPVRRVIAGFDMAMLYQDSFSHDYPEPGVVHRSLRFTFEPARRIVASMDS
jgi:hypothetical protein